MAAWASKPARKPRRAAGPGARPSSARSRQSGESQAKSRPRSTTRSPTGCGKARKVVAAYAASQPQELRPAAPRRAAAAPPCSRGPALRSAAPRCAAAAPPCWSGGSATGAPESAQQAALLGAHAARLGGAHVVVADQVERAVDEQAGHLVVEAAAAGAGLARGRLEADHDVAEERTAPLGVESLGEREREHVRRPVATAPGGVQGADLGVVHERDRELRLRALDLAQHAAGSRREEPAVAGGQAAPPARAREPHGHFPEPGSGASSRGRGPSRRADSKVS